MSWIIEPKRTWLEWIAIQVLKVGPLPRHLAIIMDGNRRFARQIQKETQEGHAEGFKKLTEVLSWCRDLGINEVTTYAFSIENFKRPKLEVQGLMNLMEEKFQMLLEEKDKLKEHSVCVRIIGNLSLLSERLQCLAAQVVVLTKDNTSCFLNVAVAYTSRDEIKASISEVCDGVKNGDLLVSDISEYTLEECLYTNQTTHPPDLLIRTSGEVRLSDFLLWQTDFTHLFFTNVLWPEINIWHILAAVFHFQRYYHKLVQLKAEAVIKLTHLETDSDSWIFKGSVKDDDKRVRVENFLNKVNETRLQKLHQLAGV